MFKYILEKKRIKKLLLLRKDGGIRIWIITPPILTKELIFIALLSFGDFIFLLRFFKTFKRKII